MMGWKGHRELLISNYIRAEHLRKRNTLIPIHLIARDSPHHKQR